MDHAKSRILRNLPSGIVGWGNYDRVCEFIPISCGRDVLPSYATPDVYTLLDTPLHCI